MCKLEGYVLAETYFPKKDREHVLRLLKRSCYTRCYIKGKLKDIKTSQASLEAA